MRSLPMKARHVPFLVVCVAVLCAPAGRASETPPNNVGKKVDSFTLSDPRDRGQVVLADCKDRKAVVVVFVGTECPLSNAYRPRLAELYQEYGPRGVQFLAVNSNTQDTPERMVAHDRPHP